MARSDRDQIETDQGTHYLGPRHVRLELVAQVVDDDRLVSKTSSTRLSQLVHCFGHLLMATCRDRTGFAA